MRFLASNEALSDCAPSRTMALSGGHAGPAGT
jgi:hypothetical protein